MLFTVLFIAVLFLIVALFSFPQLSPIPYFPSNKKDLRLIIKSLQLKNRQTVIDLGAGDGIVIFEAAKETFKKKLNTKFVAIEINPVLLCILFIRKLLHPNRKNIQILHGNMFTMNFNSLTRNSLTFYLYISPWYLEKTIANIKSQISNFRIVSYMYPMKSLRKQEKKIKGRNYIFCYYLS